ncbi:uroporphyrinogen-III synthase [Roseivivax halodurans]|nr:uroporphyrinogen-III synthase [Roseivivax halodurans]
MTRPVLLLTRTEAAALRFHGLLAEAPAHDLIVSPLLSIRFRGALPDIPAGTILLLTSANAARAYAALGGSPALRAYAVGEATAAAAREAGLAPESVGGDVEAMLSRLLADRPDAPLLHLRGAETRGRLTERLAEAGLAASEAVTYDQDLQPLSAEARSALDGAVPVVAPLFSPRTAEAFAGGRPFAAPLYIAAMSDAVADAAAEAQAERVCVADAPDARTMARETVALLRHAAALEARNGAE